MESNVDFLTSHGILPPLVRLRDLCSSTERREQHRASQLQHDDILHIQPPVPFAKLRQELDLALQQIYSADLCDRPSDPLRPVQCHICYSWYSTVTALRRHLKLHHAVRPGQTQQVTNQDSWKGLPTCSTCHKQFTTWANFRKHIHFACCGSSQADQAADLEHRLNVVEFLHYSNGAHFQALVERPDLLRYMKTHCILCGKHVMSSRGMFTHWSTDHPVDFQLHGRALETVLADQTPISPCNLCGCQFTRGHRCVIHSQIAMHSVHTMPSSQSDTGTDGALHVCRLCQKAYVTKHGLRQHIQRYHRTLEVNDSEEYLDMQQAHAILIEAVETDDCATLLLNPMVLEYLGTWCPICKTSFAQRNILTRHLRHHHSTLWHEAEKFAMDLAAMYCHDGTCFCPHKQSTKHLCTIFLQYSMLLHQTLRYAGVTGPMIGAAGEALPMAPSLAPTTGQHIAALVFNGQLDQLYLQPALRLRLTIHCCFCTATFRSGDSLTEHCRSEHAELWYRSLPAYEFLRWVLFGISGCCCNPGAHYGDELHDCISLRQVAMIYEDLGMPILIPYCFKAKDLIDLLINLVSPGHLQELTVNLMMRRFGSLWQHRGLLQMLRVTCLVCQENVTLHGMQAHLRAAHGMNLPRFQFHMNQLADIFTALHSPDPACDYCGEYLHSTITAEGMELMVREHLRTCPLMMQLSVLLSHPIWERDFHPVVTWPSNEVMLEAHRQRTQRQYHFQAPISESMDSVLLMYANWAKTFLEDDWMLQHMSHSCLICGRLHLSQQKFVHHLMVEHNFHQYLTEQLHHLLLTLQKTSSCAYCGSTSHVPAVGNRCIVLFNLATALCNGGGPRRHGSDERGEGNRDLATHPDTWSTALHRTQRRAQSVSRQVSQETQNREAQADAAETQRKRPRHDATDGKNGAETGGHHQLIADRASVPGPHQHRQWQHPPRSHADHPAMEGRPESPQDSVETPAGPVNDDTAARPSSEAECVPNQGRCGQGLLEISCAEPKHGDALPEMESQDAGTGANGGQMSDHSRDAEAPGGHSSTDGGLLDNGALSLLTSASRHTPTSHSMGLDGVVQDKSGIVASGQVPDFSCLLAADSMQSEKPHNAEIGDGSATEQHAVTGRLVRLLLNPAQTLCYANAALQCLAWVSIVSYNVFEDAWSSGFALIQALTAWSPMPLTLYDLAPFDALFSGDDWGKWEKDRQNDLTDFTCHILMQMAPKFVNNAWVTQPALHHNFEGTGLQDEKGHKLQPITLPLFDTALDRCTLTDLIQTWHDSLGLRPSLSEASEVVCLSIDRVVPPHHHKCLQWWTFKMDFCRFLISTLAH